LYFQCSDGSEYPVIFKDGDDMRQDQLVLQLFTLMDQLLRKENLDLKLIPYDVLATGPLQGLVQFIPSKTIAAIISENGTLLNYLRANNPDEGSVGTYGVEPSVIDTFVRSCGESFCGLGQGATYAKLADSWILCCNIPARRRRPALGQPSADTGW